MNRLLCFSLVATLALSAAACGDDGTSGPGGGGSGGNTGGQGGTGAAGGQGGSGAAGGQGGSGAAGGQGGSGAAGGQGGSGAAGGQGGSGASGGSGGNGGAPQCTTDGQCTLVNDCCSCLGIGPGEGVPPCAIMECFVPTCQGQGLDANTASCAVGQCVAGHDCDHSKVACDSLPPNCPAGQTATVNGLCWGGCVAATECKTVGSCDQCGDTLGCVKQITQLGAEIHCVTLPSSCNGKASCECAGGSVCVDPFDSCSVDPQGAITCSCPEC